MADSLTSGGASRATQRLVTALRQQHVDVTELVRDQGAKQRRSRRDFSVEYLSRIEGKFWRTVTGDRQFRSVGLYGAVRARDIQEIQPDIVHLNWIARGSIAVNQIPRLNRPTIWTLHDLWPVLGSFHYPMAASGPNLLLEKAVARLKRNAVSSVQLVAPSQWTADAVGNLAENGLKESVAVIPYAVDPEHFRVVDAGEARSYFGLPRDVPVVAFADLQGTKDPRKGWSTIQGVLDSGMIPKETLFVTAGGASQRSNRADGQERSGNLHVHVGQLSSDFELSLFYSMSNLVVVPSYMDVVNQIATEAQMCGTPVLCRANTGVSSTLEGSPTVGIVDGNAPEDWAEKISIALRIGMSSDGVNKREATRLWASSRWSPRIVGAQYVSLMRSML